MPLAHPSRVAPHTPRHRYLTRDQRHEVQVLSRAGYKPIWIINHTGYTRRQVDYAILSQQVTPKQRPGRPPSLTSQQIDELIWFVESSREARQMSYLALATGPFEHWQVGEDVIRHSLRKRGYLRYVALAKPPLTEEHKRIRLAWALAHRDWTIE